MKFRSLIIIFMFFYLVAIAFNCGMVYQKVKSDKELLEWVKNQQNL